MALNFSHRPLFSGHLPEDNLVSPMRIASGYLVDDKVENCFDYGRDKSDRCGSQESVHKDILDLLPSDPFGMDISTTFTAITGWLEDLKVDYGNYGNNQVTNSDGSYQLFAGLNFIWNNAMRFQSFPGNMRLDSSMNAAGGFGDGCVELAGACASCHGAFGLTYNVEDIFSLGNELVGNKDVGGGVKRSGDPLESSTGIFSDGDGGVPHAAFSFALGYLGVRDLLVVETVCKSLYSMVRNDPLLWRNIYINQPLNEKITDDILLQLTNKAQGTLQCLSLVECQRITDEGLKQVLKNNPRLSKLSVPACTRLSIEGIISSLKEFKATGSQGVKHLRIGGIYGVTHEHFEELKFLLGTDGHMRPDSCKPHFYHRGNLYLSCEDNRNIDIELCPKCQNLRLIYDCPVEACQQKEHSSQLCRACTLCIPRCSQCGRCINDSEYEETFCLELLCSDCCQELPKWQGKQENKISPPESVAQEESSSRMHLHG